MIPARASAGGTAPPRTLTIGTRGSKLALVQTELVRAALQAADPALQVVIRHITTRGDVLLDRPLAAIGDKGLFVTEIETALRSGWIDLAVHSAKDLPSELPPDMEIGAIPIRTDARDALVSRAGRLRDLPPGARVGTSSPRRTCQLRAVRPDLEILDLRGNVDTRLRKLEAGEYEALVLAAAGLIRLDRAAAVTEWLAPEVMLPAIGQGALAVEIRAGDLAVAEIVGRLADEAATAAVRAERAFLAGIGGGCASAVGAYATVTDDALTLTGLIGAADGRLVRGTVHGTPAEAAALGKRLAAQLLAEGGAVLLMVRGPTGEGDNE
ncbi:MAG: hydroxymethylbilane synthase [Chloroflexia bacterium]